MPLHLGWWSYLFHICSTIASYKHEQGNTILQWLIYQWSPPHPQSHHYCIAIWWFVFGCWSGFLGHNTQSHYLCTLGIQFVLRQPAKQPHILQSYPYLICMACPAMQKWKQMIHKQFHCITIWISCSTLVRSVPLKLWQSWSMVWWSYFFHICSTLDSYLVCSSGNPSTSKVIQYCSG